MKILSESENDIQGEYVATTAEIRLVKFDIVRIFGFFFVNNFYGTKPCGKT